MAIEYYAMKWLLLGICCMLTVETAHVNFDGLDLNVSWHNNTSGGSGEQSFSLTDSNFLKNVATETILKKINSNNISHYLSLDLDDSLDNNTSGGSRERAFNLTDSNFLKSTITETILKEIDSNNIRNYLRFLTESPHLAGTPRDEELVKYIETKWQDQGLDFVRKVTYKTLLSYPDNANPNKVHLLTDNGTVTFTTRHMEETLRPEDKHPDFVHMFNAYAPNGTVEGELVYAHYARDEDFQTLLKLKINITGKIVIAKYGDIYRGNKVYLAERYGALGIILFNDPSESAQDGEDPEQVYPNSWWLHPSGAQRGSLSLGKGDPVTPLYPSIDDAYRIPLEDTTLPKIPCQPIGYKDAQQLLQLLDGPIAPEKWQGPLPTLLRLGPKFVVNTQNKKVRLVVNNYLKIANTTNVIGIIKGSVEPDRYVMAGNHRDAWGFGAVDASSGTAQMLEVTRVFGKLLKRGWRPKRTIMFLSWGSEEYGLIGSTEFVEDNLVKLSNRGVAYINTDICTSGEVLFANAAPMLKHFVIKISKQIPAPKNASQTLYDAWKQYHIDKANVNQTETEKLIDGYVSVGYLGGGTDHVPFAFLAGVNSIDLTFSPNKLYFKKQFSSYPVYHTGFDTYYYVDKHIDPGFVHHRTCGHLNGLLLQSLADAEILPFNVTHYIESIYEAFTQLKAQGIYDQILNHSIRIDRLENALKNFRNAGKEWVDRTKNISKNDELQLRILNDQLAQLDQSFLLSEGLPLQKQYRHVVFSLSLHNFYGSSGFPGIRDLMLELRRSPDPESTWTEIEKHVSDIMIAVHSATNFLLPLHVI